jgi:hypothetical protein
MDSDDLLSSRVSGYGSDTDQSLNPGTSNSQRSRRRPATVYDAVAGRVWYNQIRANEDKHTQGSSSKLKKNSTREAPFAPEEVLFRRRNAPERYAEYDIYHAHERDLPHSGRGVLPESDLLGVIHAYSSKFYGALDRSQRQMDGRNVDGRSMDETALLAFGILLEEAGKEVLGRRGDLVFTEAAESPSSSSDERGQEPQLEPATSQPAEDLATAPASKRRKLTKSETTSTL